MIDSDGGDGDLPWVRFSVAEIADQPGPCLEPCADLLGTRDGWTVVVPNDVPAEIAVPPLADWRVAVVMSGDGIGDDDLPQILVSSLTDFDAEAIAGPAPVQPLTSVVRDEVIPAGRYVTHLGSFVAEIDAPVSLDARLGNVSQDSAGLLWGEFEGSFAVVNPTGLISPEMAPAAGGLSDARRPGDQPTDHQ